MQILYGDHGRKYRVYPYQTMVYKAIEEVAKITKKNVLAYDAKVMYLTEDDKEYKLWAEEVKGSRKVLAVIRR